MPGGCAPMPASCPLRITLSMPRFRWIRWSIFPVGYESLLLRNYNVWQKLRLLLLVRCNPAMASSRARILILDFTLKLKTGMEYSRDGFRNTLSKAIPPLKNCLNYFQEHKLRDRKIVQPGCALPPFINGPFCGPWQVFFILPFFVAMTIYRPIGAVCWYGRNRYPSKTMPKPFALI